MNNVYVCICIYNDEDAPNRNIDSFIRILSDMSHKNACERQGKKQIV